VVTLARGSSSIMMLPPLILLTHMQWLDYVAAGSKGYEVEGYNL
jgi:hypothetical protein